MNLDNNKPFVDEDNIIDLTPLHNVDTSEQQATENPVILIESSPEDNGTHTVTVKKHRRWPWIIVNICVTAAVIACAYAAWRYYKYNYAFGVPVSASVEDNIAKLQAPAKKVKPEVVFSQDSILGVALNLYELRGLKAEITNIEPDSTDMNVMFYSRCSDYGRNGQYIGSLVENGKELQSDVSRLGYFASFGTNSVIGVARSEKVKDFCVENGGNFFRQFILVSAGTLPEVFHLHGKIERRGIGYDDHGRLFYIETRNPETMYDFADALREYGFTDAIYITGGKCHSYYRTRHGKYHNIGLPKSYIGKQGFMPWLVFKKK